MNARIVVVGGQSTINARVVAALIAAGHEVEQADTFPITERPKSIGWWASEDATQNTYGPPKKGKGGKIQRW